MANSLPQILLVDDIEVNLILLETALRKEKAKLFRAANGPEALLLTEEHEFALIILDVSMPIMNGFELAARIREQALNGLTPIIFISANMFDEFSVSQGYRSGAVDYISKPYHHEVLVSKVRVFLQLYIQKKDLQEQWLVLQQSNNRYQEIQETLRLKLQLEKAVSLASARFSGNFDLENSIYFMLRDIASVCNCKIINFIPCLSNISIAYKEGTIPTKPSETLVRKVKSRLSTAFLDVNTDILACYSKAINTWVLPEKSDKLVTIAIKVASSEKLFGMIVLEECSGISNWETSELNSLTVFGTVTGNALERHYTREALIESEQRYKSYIKHAPEGIVITSNNGEIIEYNEAFDSIFNSYCKVNKLVNIKKLLNKDNSTGNFTSLLNGKTSKGEFIVNINSQNKFIKAESAKLPAKQYLIFCTDITKELEIEKHLIQTERMVGIGEMATGIAHEINQPLNTISFSIDNLFHALNENKADKVYIKEKSKKIFDSIHRMRNIIEHVRNFARGNDDVIKSSFNVEEPVVNALSFFSGELKAASINVIKEIDERLNNKLIYGNTYKIEQVLLNLLSNARDSINDKKAIEGEGYQPLILINVIWANNDKVMLTISDNGMGMTADQLTHITRPFYTSKAPGKGTGLGLAISNTIVTEHCGEISFSSEPGQGTSVKIELPLILTTQVVIV